MHITTTSRLISLFALAVAISCGNGKAAGKGKTGTDDPGDKPGPVEETPARAKARGPEHAVYSLLDNRLSAHVVRGGGIVAVAGSGAFAKYLHFGKPKVGWELRQTVDGQKVAVADKHAAIDVPLTKAQADAAEAIHLRVHAESDRNLTVEVNGKRAGNGKVPAGWSTQKVDLPDGLAQAGENRVQLVFGKGDTAVAWIQLGGDPKGDDTPRFYDSGKNALVLPEGGGLAWYIQVPKDGRVVGDVVGDGCEVKVRVAAHDGKPVEGVLDGKGSAVEIGALAGKVARLDLAASGCKEAKLAAAALAVPGEAPKVQRSKRPKHVILWIMDSLRADRVKPFFATARPEVPNFDKLVATAAVFKNAYVQGNESQASHASIWSSTYVGVHRLTAGVKKLDTKFDILPELMKGAKLYTSGVSANGYITAKKGFGEWDAYRNHIHDGGGVKGEDVYEKAVASIEKRTDKPFFLYLGTIDTHVSWRAKQPWIEKYSPNYQGKYKKEALGVDVEKMAKGDITPTEKEKQHIIAIYDSNVSYQDDLLGQLFAKLTELKIADDTMVIITADHGDEQWEDGRVGHGASQRESLIHVPLVIYYPPLFPGGIVEEGADTIDIVPTILDALGLSPPDAAQGMSLIPLAQGEGRSYPRPAISSKYEDSHAMRLGDWKLVTAGNNVRLFDMSGDWSEKSDVADSRPIERRFLTDAFSPFLINQKDWKKSRWGVASNVTAAYAQDQE